MVTAVKADGGRIRIVYDDDTSEMADFPDADIIVDAEDNGKHAKSAGGNDPSVNPFIPPPVETTEELVAVHDCNKSSEQQLEEGRVTKKKKRKNRSMQMDAMLHDDISPSSSRDNHSPQQQQEPHNTMTKKKKLKLRITAKSVAARLSSSSNDESGNLDVDSDEEDAKSRLPQQSEHEPLNSSIHKIVTSSPTTLRTPYHHSALDQQQDENMLPPLVEDSVSSSEQPREKIKENSLLSNNEKHGDSNLPNQIMESSYSLLVSGHPPTDSAGETSLRSEEKPTADLSYGTEETVGMSDPPKNIENSPMRTTGADTKESFSTSSISQAIGSPTKQDLSVSDGTPSKQSAGSKRMMLSPMPSFDEQLLTSPVSHDKEGARSGRGAPKKKRGREAKEISTTPRRSKAKSKAVDDKSQEEEEENDENWVQCDRCHKWRMLPESVDMDSLPERWFCEMNKYDSRRNKCNAPEQTSEEVTEEREKAKTTPKKRRRKSQEVKSSSPEPDGGVKGPFDAILMLLKRSQSRDESIASIGTEGGTEATKDQPTVYLPLNQASDNNLSTSIKEVPQAAIGFPTSTDAADSTDTTKKAPGTATKNSKAEPDCGNSDGETAKGKGPRKGRKKEKETEKTAISKPAGARVGGKQGKDKADDSQEWVQCEKCDKWRRLPPRIKAEELPDVWYCSMNTWDVKAASCAAPEDKTEAGARDYTILGGADNRSGGSKVTYRNLIFGSGKKQSRPMSERARASDSIFMVPGSDQPGEGGHPTVSYAESSCFVQRGLSHRTKLEETSGAALLELMSQSRLWSDLYSRTKMGHPSGYFPSIPVENQFLSNNNVRAASCSEDFCSGSKTTMESMKALIYHALGENTLSNHEILLEAQCRNGGGEATEDWSELRAACTIELVENALEELVKDGMVEEIHGCLPNEKFVATKLTRFRRVARSNITTRCIKLAKPWKSAANSGTKLRWSDTDECEELLQLAILRARKRFELMEAKLGPDPVV